MVGKTRFVNKDTVAVTNLEIEGSLVDASGNEQIKVGTVASAVNEITVTNAATGSGPSIAATGGDTNVDITVKGKGTGAVVLGQTSSAGVKLAADQAVLDSSGNELVKFTKTTSAVNEITVANAATGGDPMISATGGDTDIDLQLAGKGAGNVLLGSLTSGTATGGAATVNAQRGYVTSEGLTTAADAAYTLTLTNSKIATGSLILVSVGNGTNTQGIPVLSTAKVTAAGTAVIVVYNLHASQALNGTLEINFLVI